MFSVKSLLSEHNKRLSPCHETGTIASMMTSGYNMRRCT